MKLSGQIYQNADTAVSVLSDLLNYDKIEHGELSLETTIVPIWDLLERTWNEFELPARYEADSERILSVICQSIIASAELSMKTCHEEKF